MELFVGFEGSTARRRLTGILERWEANGDRRSAFLGTWVSCTDAVLVAMHNGRFANPAWVLALLDDLAGHYLITIEPEDDVLLHVTPPAWRAAHDVAASRTATRHEALILGVNAVINNDLPQAVCNALLADWPLNNIGLERRHQDLCLVLDIVSAAMDGGECAAVDLETRTRLAHLVDAWRDEMWQNAVAMVTAVDERWRDLIRESIEHTALRRAHLIMCDIVAGSHLLEMPGHRLDYVFPPRHRPDACRLSVALPVWGGSARATTP